MTSQNTILLVLLLCIVHIQLLYSKNCYEKLGIGTTASDREIKKKFRKLAMKYHPDKVKEADKEKAEAKFKELAKCYEILKDPETRQKYDASGYNEKFDQGGGQRFNFDNFDFSDLFSSFFGGGGSKSGPGGGGFQFNFGGPQGSGDRRGQQGFGQQGFGSGGSRPNNRRAPQVKSVKPKYIKVTLEDLMDDSIHSVNGIEVKIPAGCPNDYEIKKKGKIYKIQLKPHNKFERKSKKEKALPSDLYYTLDITLNDALFGNDFEIETIDNELELFHLDYITPQTAYKIKNQGLPRFKNKEGSRGHLYIKFNIIFPDNLSSQDLDTIKTLSNNWKYDEGKKSKKKKQQKRKTKREL